MPRPPRSFSNRRLPRRRRKGRSGPFTWFIVIVGVLSAVALTLYGLLRGGFGPGAHSEWLELSRELEAAGEPIYFDDVIPRELPADQNFFGSDLFKGLETGTPGSELLQRALNPGGGLSVSSLLGAASKGNGASLEAIAKMMRDAGLDRTKREYLLAGDRIIAVMRDLNLDFSPLVELADRPGSRFPIDYSTPFPELQHLRHIEALGDWLAIQAIARISTGNSEAATVDLMLLWRLADSVATEPFLESQRVRRRLLAMFAGCVRVGIAWGAWSSEELAQFSQSLERAMLLTDLGWALRGERAQLNSVVQAALSGKAPAATEVLQNWLGGDLVKLNARGVRSRQVLANKALQQMLDQLADGDGISPAALTPPESMPLPAEVRGHFARLAEEARVFAQIQTYLVQAQIACALERYHFDHGRYPETLDALEPDYLPSVPKDPVSGRPMDFQLDPEHSYRLISVGWQDGKPWIWTRD